MWEALTMGLYSGLKVAVGLGDSTAVSAVSSSTSYRRQIHCTINSYKTLVRQLIKTSTYNLDFSKHFKISSVIALARCNEPRQKSEMQKTIALFL